MLGPKRVWRMENRSKSGPFGGSLLTLNLFANHELPQCQGDKDSRKRAEYFLYHMNYVCSWGSEHLMLEFLLPDADVSVLDVHGFTIKVLDAHDYMELEDGQVIFDRKSAVEIECMSCVEFFARNKSL